MEWKSELIQDTPDRSGKKHLFYTIEHIPCKIKRINITKYYPWCVKCGKNPPHEVYQETFEKQEELNHTMKIMDGYRVC